MFCFVMALKSKAVSRDWPRVCQLYEASLRSAYQQTDPNIKIITICHEKPELQGTYDERAEFISVDFPPPVRIETPLCMADKWRKLALGMVRAGELKPDWIMIMDADDLVSNRLAAYAHAHPQTNGWIFKQGYRYPFGSRWIELDHNFSSGTDAIVNAKVIEFPRDLEPDSIERCCVLKWGHSVIAVELATLGTPLEPLPFPGTVYIHSHGENDSHFGLVWQGYSPGQFLKLLPRQRWCGRRIRSEFSMR